MASVTKPGNLILNEGNNAVFSATAPQFKLQFPRPFNAVEGNTISLLNVTMYNSWYNVSQAFNNLTFSYRWSDGITYQVVLDPGIYTIFELNQKLEFAMTANNHYLRNADGFNQYYLSFVLVPTYYKCIVISSPTPASLPVGWTNPGGASNINGVAPQLIIENNSFGKLIGFTPQTIPSVQISSSWYQLSNLAPEISPVTAVNVSCSPWVNDGRFSTKPANISSFTPLVSRGELINFTPPQLLKYHITPGQYQSIEISLYDQAGRALTLQDLTGMQVILRLE